MKTRHWLIKFAPFRTSWEEIVARGIFTPRGIRSPEARKHLSAMRLGDPVLFYQSQQNQSVVGILEVVREAYPDPTSADSQWMTCDFVPLRTLPSPVSLEAIKANPSLWSLPLVRRPRLSVMPLTMSESEIIQALALK
jgi:predicted RNA-binding protein with PUA-like domain